MKYLLQNSFEMVAHCGIVKLRLKHTHHLKTTLVA